MAARQTTERTLDVRYEADETPPHSVDAALELIASASVDVWPLEEADVMLARQLHERHPRLQARDLCHLASCQRRDVREIMTFDRALAAVAPRT